MNTDTPTFTFVRSSTIELPAAREGAGWRDRDRYDDHAVDVELWRNDRSGRWHVVRVGEHCGIPQVYSVMPSDCPRGSGVWFARYTDPGIDYVSRGYSPAWIRELERRAR